MAGQAELLRSAVENVVRNAVRHTEKSTAVEISLQIQAASTLKSSALDSLVSDAEPTQCAVLTVRDRGEGVPEEALEMLFRPFYRVAEARDRKSGGVGLGLSITDRAVRFHGGTVRALNARGGGLLVEIRLPAQIEC